MDGAASKSPVFAIPEEIDVWLRAQHMSCDVGEDDPATSLRREIRLLRQRLQHCELELARILRNEGVMCAGRAGLPGPVVLSDE